jgi:hypothetical protein
MGDIALPQYDINPTTLKSYSEEEREALREWTEVFEQLRARGLVRIVGQRGGRPVYGLTEPGRHLVRGRLAISVDTDEEH